MRYLMATSAYWQGRLNEKAKSRMISLSESGELAVCSLAMMEILLSAKNSHEWRAMREALESLPRVEISDLAAGIDLQGELARRGQHRTPVTDVLVAATAAEHDLAVLHYDRDFERLCEITGGAHEWVVPPGSGH